MQPVDTGHRALQGVKYAGFWARTAAWLIDIIIIYILWYIAQILTGLPITGEEMVDYELTGKMVYDSTAEWISFIMFVVYFIATTASKMQATIGKYVIGLQIIRSDGEQIDFVRSVGRVIVWQISFVVCFIGMIMAAFMRDKQALHDMVLDTRVVYKHTLPSQQNVQMPQQPAQPVYTQNMMHSTPPVYPQPDNSSEIGRVVLIIAIILLLGIPFAIGFLDEMSEPETYIEDTSASDI